MYRQNANVKYCSKWYSDLIATAEIDYDVYIRQRSSTNVWLVPRVCGH